MEKLIIYIKDLKTDKVVEEGVCENMTFEQLADNSRSIVMCSHKLQAPVSNYSEVVLLKDDRVIKRFSQKEYIQNLTPIEGRVL